MASPSTVELRKYERIFIVYLVVATLALVLLRTFTEVSGTGVSLVLPAIAMWAAIAKFSEDHARLPDDGERRRLMQVGMGATTVLLLAGLVAIAGALDVSGLMLTALFGLGLLFNWASLRTGFWLSRKLPTPVGKSRR